MKALVPPVVSGNPQTLDAGRGVDELGHLLFQGHAGDEVVNPYRGREGWIAIGGILLACAGTRGGDEKQTRKKKK